MKMMRVGKVAMVAPAMISSHSVRYSPENDANPTGNVTTAACPNGNEEHSGITNLVQFDLGYTFLF